MDTQLLKTIIKSLNQELEALDLGKKPNELYEPIAYMLRLGGKRLRPILAILSYRVFQKNWETILTPASAIELFHNFTLMHDDIMDKAPLRRGMATVHEKWNQSVAILSGDVMLVKVYEQFDSLEPRVYKQIIQKFNQTACEVCEGQQFDMNYEQESEIPHEEYLKMIRLKTAVLLGFSCWLGATLANATEEQADILYEFGVQIGITFQIKDDLLDVFGQSDKVGKQTGGDILANKKTFLLVKALELASGETKIELKKWLEATDYDQMEKIESVTRIYQYLDLPGLTEYEAEKHFQMALEQLNALNREGFETQELNRFAAFLNGRES